MNTPSQIGGDMGLPETFYAPAARASETALRKAIAVASHNPVTDTVMRTFGGLVAVLNENRQVLAVNSALLQAIGIENAEESLGLRPGEALGCVRAHAHPGILVQRDCVRCSLGRAKAAAGARGVRRCSGSSDGVGTGSNIRGFRANPPPKEVVSRRVGGYHK